MLNFGGVYLFYIYITNDGKPKFWKIIDFLKRCLKECDRERDTVRYEEGNISFTLPETNIAHENPHLPSKYRQNGGFSMAMLVYRSVTKLFADFDFAKLSLFKIFHKCSRCWNYTPEV